MEKINNRSTSKIYQKNFEHWLIKFEIGIPKLL